MKKTINKLSLNKSTVSNLNAAEMNQKIGGVRTGTCMPSVSITERTNVKGKYFHSARGV
ncbi:MAG: class I lanthipeptide [Bacteroidetes bacterium]|nr:class I lanthipeptide [Bacteroidota bacterium]